MEEEDVYVADSEEEGEDRSSAKGKRPMSASIFRRTPMAIMREQNSNSNSNIYGNSESRDKPENKLAGITPSGESKADTTELVEEKSETPKKNKKKKKHKKRKKKRVKAEDYPELYEFVDLVLGDEYTLQNWTRIRNKDAALLRNKLTEIQDKQFQLSQYKIDLIGDIISCIT